MAWQRTGTVTIAQGSDAVSGVGVNWMRQHVGWIMVTAASGTLHEIKEIISSTEVRLAAPVTDADASGLGYFIIPTHALNADLIDAINQMITQFETSRDVWQAVYQDFSAGPYQLWLDQGNAGTVGDYLASLKGNKGDKGDIGDPGASAYEIWLAAGHSGDEDAFLDWFTQQALTQAGAARDAAQAAQGASETARDAAQGSASQVASDRAAVAAIFDSFDDRYLGSKASDPLTDNDGDPLLTGAVYWNSVVGETRFFHSGNWERPSATAATSAQQAVDAKLAALAAQAAAETAQTAAVAAQAAAEAAKGDAETAQTAAQAAQAGAETAQSGAETAQAAASTSETNSAASATASATAQTASEAARDAAGTSETDAATSASAAATARAAAETAQGGADTAKAASEAAQVSAETARDSAQAHANAASLASNASEWVSEGAYAYGQNVWSPLDFFTYRAKLAHSGSTVDPSLDEVNFAPASGVSASQFEEVSTQLRSEAVGFQCILDGVGKLYSLGSIETVSDGGAVLGQPGSIISSTGSGTIDTSGFGVGLAVEIPHEQALQFSGRRVRVDVLARAASTDPAAYFCAAYSTSENGNSGTNSLLLTDQFQWHSFYYDLPVAVAGNSDFIILYGDTSQSDLATHFARVTVQVDEDTSAENAGSGAQFAQFEVNTSGELILSFYDPAGAVEAGDFSINAAGELLLEIGL